MRVLVTAGATREHIDPVRFITNASRGKMGYAVAAAAAAAGHDVTLLTGPVNLAAPQGCKTVRFVLAADLKRELAGRFEGCDALIMAAAVGDFRVESPQRRKIPRGGGPITIRLAPTEDILAAVAAGKRPGQVVVAFAVEDGPADEAQAKARAEMADKSADYVVVNTPEAMGSDESYACILSGSGMVLPWARRPKGDLGEEIIAILARPAAGARQGN